MHPLTLTKKERVPLLLHMIHCREILRPRYEELLGMAPDVGILDSSDPRAGVWREELERLTAVRDLQPSDFLQFARQVQHKFEPNKAFACVEEIFRLREMQLTYEAAGAGRFDHPPTYSGLILTA
jgi:hypothetical protein